MAGSRKQGIFAVIAGTILLILSLIVLISFPALYQKQLEKETTLVNNTVLYEMWKDLPLPIYQKLYFFNVTNTDEFIKFGTPLEVIEVGPYTYKSKWIKEEIEWNNGTVSYIEKKTFYFDPENSVGSEKDYIYTLNGPLIFAGSYIENTKPKLQKWASVLFKLFNEKLIIKKTIGQLAFGGYNDIILKYGKYIQNTPFTDGKFAWLYKRNATDDGEFTVNTGEYKHSELNLIKSWNGSAELPFWKNGSKCNMINGSNAEIGPPILSGNQVHYTFFQPIFCRSMTFDYDGMKNHLGIDSKRFKNNVRVFGNKRINPDNYCFDNKDYDFNNSKPSLPSGVMNMSSCQFGAPVILSFPHFYLGDESLLIAVTGLEPNASLHESYIDVEPMTGVSIALAMRFQVNVFLQQNPFYEGFQNITSGVYPIFWMEMVAEIDDKLAKSLNDQLKNPKQIAYSVIGILAVVSVIMLITGLYILHSKDHDEDFEERKPLLEPERKSSYTGITSRDFDNLTGPSENQCNFIIPRGMATNITAACKEHDKATIHSKQIESQSKRLNVDEKVESPTVRVEKCVKSETTSVGEQKKTESSIRNFFERSNVP